MSDDLDPWEGAVLDERSDWRPKRPWWKRLLRWRRKPVYFSYHFSENYRHTDTPLFTAKEASAYVGKVMKVLSVLKKGKYVPPRDCYFDVE